MIKNITFNAEESLLNKAREKALKERKSLNGLFREWLKVYIGRGRSSNHYAQLMKKADYVKIGRKFTREAMNER